MAANIFGERFVGRAPAWHNIGKVVPDGSGIETAKDAFRFINLDYQIHKIPMQATMPDGTTLQMPNRVALVREPVADDPHWVDLGTASDQYRIIQNMDLAEIIDNLDLTSKFKVETAGALAAGSTVFIALKGDQATVRGLDSETIQEYFLITDKRDGGTSLQIAYTPVRVVCENTLVMGINAATKLAKISHIEGQLDELPDRIALMAGLEQQTKTSMELFNLLASTPVSGKRASLAIAVAYPHPSKPAKLEVAESLLQSYDESLTLSDLAGNETFSTMSTLTGDGLHSVYHVWQRECNRQDQLREQAKVRLERFNDEHPKVAETAWAVWNAVVENEDHRDGPAGMYESALWGARAKVKVKTLEYLTKAINA